MYLFYAGYQE